MCVLHYYILVLYELKKREQLYPKFNLYNQHPQNVHNYNIIVFNFLIFFFTQSLVFLKFE